MKFETIYNENYRSILTMINSKINNVEQAEDLAAEIFIKIHNRLSDYDETKSKLRTWIWNIAKNTLIDYWRKRTLKSTSITDLVDDEGHETFVHTDYSNPETTFETNEVLSNINHVIESLPNKYSKIVDLFFIKQYSYDEIAETLNIPLGTVKGNLFKARKLLHDKLSNL